MGKSAQVFRLTSFINPGITVPPPSLKTRSFTVAPYPSVKKIALKEKLISTNQTSLRAFTTSANVPFLPEEKKEQISWIFEVYADKTTLPSLNQEIPKHKIFLNSPLDHKIIPGIEKKVAMEADALITDSELERAACFSKHCPSGSVAS